MRTHDNSRYLKHLSILVHMICSGLLITGCGQSIAERQAAYADAKQILEKEQAELLILQNKAEGIKVLESRAPLPSDPAFRAALWYVGVQDYAHWEELIEKEKQAAFELRPLVENQLERVRRAEKMVSDAAANLQQ